VRLEYDPGGVGDVAGLARRLAQRCGDRLGVPARFELVLRGRVPRFAYKAARVVDE
jgi:phenylacetate-coenzyme A ligase PaaK-like adenylate-forming protein